jgi:hypothetical protein
MLPGRRRVSATQQELPARRRPAGIAGDELHRSGDLALEPIARTARGLELGEEPPGRNRDHRDTHEDLEQHRTADRPHRP